MAKLRHIALIVPDPESAAKFFEDAFEMKVAGKARRGVYVSDGVINVALRPTSAQSYYEAKFKDPLGIVFDLTHTGWVGAVKDVVAKR
jgi:lactoylglutathione lyase